jgi:hypothetical protein
MFIRLQSRHMVRDLISDPLNLFEVWLMMHINRQPEIP